MPASYIYKAQGERGKKGIFLTPQEDPKSQPYAVLPDGRRIPGQYLNTNEGRHQYLFGPDILGQQGVKIEYNNQTIDLEDSNKSYEGNNPFDGWAYRNKGDLGSGGGAGGGGYPGGFAPGNIGYGAYPAYLGGLFPDPTFANFSPVGQVPFKYTDPFEFSAKYGEFSRGEVRRNQELSKELALDQLNTELEGLRAFAPEAGVLKRQQIAEDNRFNQAQRTQQLQEALPWLQERFAGMEGDLEGQRGRASTYAEGRVPDPVLDRAYELGIRSRAADTSRTAGFGGMAAMKTSDLMSAEARIGLSQYGDQLLSSNLAARSGLINQRAGLELAPTSYSDAGAQIRTIPSVSGASLAQGNLGQLNQLSMLSASQAFAGETGQQQYITNLETARRQFNAQGNFSESQFNAGIANEFALTKFGYDVGYAGTLAGASQTDINTGLGLQQQAQANQASQQAQSQAQNANQIGAIATGISSIAGAAASIFGGGSGGQISSGYTGTGAINVGGVGYAPAGEVGGPSGSIVVPQGQPIPQGYRPYRPAPNGSMIAVPVGGSQAPVQGQGQAPGPSGTPGQSNADFSGTPQAPSGTGSGNQPGYQPDVPEGQAPPAPEGTVTDPNTGAHYFPEDYPDGYPGTSEASLDTSPPPVTSRMARMERAQNADVQKFQEDIGVGVKPDEEEYITSQGRSVLSDAGIHYAQSKVASVPAGVDPSGKRLFGDPKKMASNDPKVGSEYVNSFFETFLPMKIFSKKDTDVLQGISQAAGSAALISQLDQYWQNKDPKGFVGALAQGLRTPIINAITDDPKDRAGLKSLFSAYNLYQNWDRMSGAQKGLGVASTALHAFTYSTGEDLASKPIIEQSGNVPGLNVGQALQLFQLGYNTYSMVDNWGDLNNLQKVAYGTSNVSSMALLAKDMGLLGSGTTGAAVNITGAQLASAGFSAAPAYGVGAVTGAAGSTIPAGYTSVATLRDGSIVAVPQANAGTSAVGTSTLQGAAGAAAIAAGAYQVYKGWGMGGEKGALNGATGGLAISGGLMALGATNPYLLGGIVAVSVLGNMAKTGKHEDQIGRDKVRDVYQQRGLLDSNYQITLADGTAVDLGIDGRGGKHGVTNRDLLQGDHKNLKDLRSYDVDYTNDLDYASSMGGLALSRLISGGTAKNIDQMGGQLGNAALGNVGFGKEMTKENFDKMAANQRAFFSQSGVKSKEDAMQLVNLAEAEKRLSAADAVTTRQAINMFFDPDGYQLAQKLMAGRHRGAEVVANGQNAPSKETVTLPSRVPGQPNVTVPSSTAPKAPAGDMRVPERPLDLPRPSSEINFRGTPTPRIRQSSMRMSKEEMRALNAQRYAGGGAARGQL